MSSGDPISYDNESGLYSINAVVFVGEFLQVLTGGLFSAAVHRVACEPRYVCAKGSAGTGGEQRGEGGDDSSSVEMDGARISCPMIIRGRNAAVIDFNGSQYSHPFRDTGMRRILYSWLRFVLLHWMAVLTQGRRRRRAAATVAAPPRRRRLCPWERRRRSCPPSTEST